MAFDGIFWAAEKLSDLVADAQGYYNDNSGAINEGAQVLYDGYQVLTGNKDPKTVGRIAHNTGSLIRRGHDAIQAGKGSEQRTPAKDKLKHDISRQQNEETPRRPTNPQFNRNRPGLNMGDSGPGGSPPSDPQPGPASANMGMPSGGGDGSSSNISGGLRDGVVQSSSNQPITCTHTFRKKHTWMIKMDPDNYQPVIQTSFQTTLKSRWYELPTNEVGFYVDRAEWDHVMECSRYFKITHASTRFKKCDVITINDSVAGQTSASLHSQWQPALCISRPKECLPAGRSRVWSSQDSSTTKEDNSFAYSWAQCGLAHMGSPTFLPKVTWQLGKEYQLSNLITPENFAVSQIYTSNSPILAGHYDILWPCHTQFEMAAAGGLTIDQRPMPAWRSAHDNPFVTWAYGYRTTNDISQNQIPNQVEEISDYRTNRVKRKCNPMIESEVAVEDESGAEYIVNRLPIDRQVIGADPWMLSHQWRDSSDRFLPHMSDSVNGPVFIAFNRLPKIANQQFTVIGLIELDTELTVEMQTPFLFPFNPKQRGGYDSIRPKWSGDSRNFMVMNNCLQNLANEDRKAVEYNRGQEAILGASDNTTSVLVN